MSISETDVMFMCNVNIIKYKKRFNFILLKVFITNYTIHNGASTITEDVDITVESFEDFVKAYRKDKRVILIPIGIILGFLALFYFLG